MYISVFTYSGKPFVAASENGDSVYNFVLDVRVHLSFTLLNPTCAQKLSITYYEWN